jgi:hypothetical protein
VLSEKTSPRSASPGPPTLPEAAHHDLGGVTRAESFALTFFGVIPALLRLSLALGSRVRHSLASCFACARLGAHQPPDPLSQPTHCLVGKRHLGSLFVVALVLGPIF